MPGYVESDGVLCIEAENYDEIVAGLEDSWSVVSEVDASGGSALFASPDDGTLYATGWSAGSPRVDYDVIFSQAGTYYVWVRNRAPNNDGNSVHVGLDGAENATASEISGPNVGAGYAYQWDRTQHTSGAIATLVVPSVGAAVLNVWMREDGVYFDKILLTLDSAYTPMDTGPPESARSQ